MADRNITTNVIINGVNRLSRPIEKGVNRSISSLSRLERSARAISFASFQAGRSLGALALGLGASLVYPTKKALEFEDKMADVAKVTNTKVGSAQFKVLGEEVKNLSEYLRISATDAAELYTNLAQGGVGTDQLYRTAQLAGRMGVAFDVAAGEAGSAFSHIKNVMGLTFDQTSLVSDAINELSNNLNDAKASRILTFLTSGGSGVGLASNTAGKDIAAMGAALIAQGKSGEEAATIMERFFKNIVRIKTVRPIFDRAGGGVKGFMAVLEKGMKSSDPVTYFQQFGEFGNDIMLLARNMKSETGLLGALKLVADEQKMLGSVTSEANNRWSTGLSKLTEKWRKFERVMIDTGDRASGPLGKLLDSVTPLIEKMGDWIQANPKATTQIIKMLAGVTALSAGLAAMSFLVGGVASVYSFAAKILGFFASKALLARLAATGLGKAFLGLRSTFLVTELGIGAIVTGLAGAAIAVAALTYLVYDAVTGFHKLTRLMTGFKAFGRNIVPYLQALGSGQLDKAAAISDRADLQADVEYKRMKLHPEVPTSEERRLDRARRLSGQNIGAGAAKASGISPYTQQPVKPAAIIPDMAATPRKVSPLAPKQNIAGDSTVFNFAPTLNFPSGTPENVKSVVDQSMAKARMEFEQKARKMQEDKKRTTY